MNEKCSPQACMCAQFSPQSVELFGNVVESLGGRNTLEEVGHCGESLVLFCGLTSGLCSAYWAQIQWNQLGFCSCRVAFLPMINRIPLGVWPKINLFSIKVLSSQYYIKGAGKATKVATKLKGHILVLQSQTCPTSKVESHLLKPPAYLWRFWCWWWRYPSCW